jgi:Domain of unknown function (DUF4416)
MWQIQTQRPVLLISAAFSRYAEALAWARQKLTEQWGAVALASPPFEHTETHFYDATMGTGLKKMFFAFETLIDAAELVERKLQANQWEADYAQLGYHAEPRPLNLDPGYITEAKLVLATTKDRDHRLYLDRGIFAEVTLHYHHGAWQPRPWTYPDYCRADYHAFFLECRVWLRKKYRQEFAQ